MVINGDQLWTFGSGDPDFRQPAIAAHAGTTLLPRQVAMPSDWTSGTALDCDQLPTVCAASGVLNETGDRLPNTLLLATSHKGLCGLYSWLADKPDEHRLVWPMPDCGAVRVLRERLGGLGVNK